MRSLDSLRGSGAGGSDPAEYIGPVQFRGLFQCSLEYLRTDSKQFVP
jgi:hypothetical protein